MLRPTAGTLNSRARRWGRLLVPATAAAALFACQMPTVPPGYQFACAMPGECLGDEQCVSGCCVAIGQVPTCQRPDGGGGQDAGVVRRETGSSCTSSGECVGGQCDTNWPGGYCTGQCPCTTGSQCWQSGTSSSCMKRCSSVGDCRTGYMCAAVTGAGGATVCWIDCRQNPTWCSSGGFLCGSDGFCKSKLLFTSSYQKLPDTGAATVEFRCVGTVGQAGRRCELSTGDPVDLRINGSQYKLYGGCVGSSNQCQTMVVGTSFKESSSSAPGRLFCEAMGYPPASTLMATMTVAVRPTAVVQTNPFAYGTSNSKVDAYRFVECAP